MGPLVSHAMAEQLPERELLASQSAISSSSTVLRLLGLSRCLSSQTQTYKNGMRSTALPRSGTTIAATVFRLINHETALTPANLNQDAQTVKVLHL